jgi:hypothetical protein
LAMISCSKSSISQQIHSQASQCDSVWLCEVDTSTSIVGYRTKYLVKNNVNGMQYTTGQLLPVEGPTIEPHTLYGDEALVFLTSRSIDNKVVAKFILTLHDGKTGDGMSREEVINLVK